VKEEEKGGDITSEDPRYYLIQKRGGSPSKEGERRNQKEKEMGKPVGGPANWVFKSECGQDTKKGLDCKRTWKNQSGGENLFHKHCSKRKKMRKKTES